MPLRLTRREPLRTRVAASATNVVLAAQNLQRTYIEIHNDSLSALRICAGDPATLTDYNHFVPPGYVWWPEGSLYTGAIHGIWVTATGAAQVTEYI